MSCHCASEFEKSCLSSWPIMATARHVDESFHVTRLIHSFVALSPCWARFHSLHMFEDYRFSVLLLKLLSCFTRVKLLSCFTRCGQKGI